ncbi:MAG: hypothetical protein LBE91_06405 [Tannerella sp.]|jgi:hypothetical protein|nr:hypothetical protein [Tannerella sp.]
MKVIEILNFNRELLNRLFNLGITPKHYRFIDLYNEFIQLKRQGCKVTYIVAHLADKYGVCERKVYEIARHFDADCETVAAEKMENV